MCSPSIAFIAEMEAGKQETNDLSVTMNEQTAEEGSGTYVSQSQLAAREVAKTMAPVVESNPAVFASGNPQNLRDLVIKLTNQDPEGEKDVARWGEGTCTSRSPSNPILVLVG